MSLNSTPVLQNERADILDILRGFAILGILLDNMFGFTGWGFFTQAQREALPTWPADGLLGLSELTLVHGKFYSLFSLLFGIGFSIILIRNEQKGINPLKIFYRRLFILLLIGAGHLFLLWEGDILFLYALVGFVLPLFRKCSDRALIICAIALIALPILIDLIKVLTHIKTGDFLEAIAKSIDQKTGLPTDDSFSQYLYSSDNGWQHWRNWQASGWLYRYAYIIESNRIPKVLGMFLFGFYAGRKMIYANLETHVPLLKKLRRWGFIVGIPLSIAMAFFEIDGNQIPNIMGLADSILYAASVVPLSLAITAAICLQWVKTKGQTKWKWLAPVGRMALTNYIMHTVICITLFYGVGFNLGGHTGPAIFFPVAFLIYTVQVIYSNWWFTYFNYGPLEWIWRQITYGKRLSLQKKNSLLAGLKK